MTDARADVKVIAIDIAGSVQSFGSGYDIGPRLRKCTNVIHNWVTHQGESVFPFARPDLPFAYDQVFNPPAKNPNGQGFWLGVVGDSDFYVGAQDQATDYSLIYNLETGEFLREFTLDNQGNFLPADVLGQNVKTAPWSFAYASNISMPTTFLCAAGTKYRAKIIDNGGTRVVVKYVQQPIPGPPDTPFDSDGQVDFEARPRICYYHLNRIWWGYQSIITRRSLVFFSDPFNVDIIRSGNFLDIPDLCNVMFRASPSDLDIGSAPHFFFGCAAGIWILDGDPNQGNASFRQIKKDLGIHLPTHTAEITGGSVFLATDNRLWFIASGSFEPMPISNPNRQQFSHLNHRLYLSWRAPYLYVLDGTNSICWIADFSNFPQELYWTGPHTNSGNGMALQGFVTDHPTTHLIYGAIGIDPTELGSLGAFYTGVDAKMETGYIYEPNSDVGFKRGLFKFRQTNADQLFTLKITNNAGFSDIRPFTVPASAVAGPDVVYHALVVFDPDKISIGKFFFLELSGNNLETILDWKVEYRVVPRKD